MDGTSGLREMSELHVEPKRDVILVVEDDPMVRRVYERALSRDHDVVSVDTGDRAVEELGRQRFGVVVSDIDVPGLSGIELLKRVRGIDVDLPVVLVTGWPSIESAQDAVNFGAFRYLTKPVDPDVLRDVVTRAGVTHALAALRRARAEIAAAADGNGLSDRTSRATRFASALSSLWMAFQPIISWRERRVVGHEALLRTGEPTLARPIDLLDVAEQLGRTDELGRAVRRAVAAAIPDAPDDTRIFINLHARDLSETDLVDGPLRQHSKRIVLEVTERASLDAVDDLVEHVTRLRACGYSIAIDDLGAGYAGLTSLARLEPEVVKIDMSLARNVHQSTTKQHLVQSITRLCTELGMQVVTEGVENIEERDALVELGCDLFQGYLFSRPGRGFAMPELG